MRKLPTTSLMNGYGASMETMRGNEARHDQKKERGLSEKRKLHIDITSGCFTLFFLIVFCSRKTIETRHPYRAQRRLRSSKVLFSFCSLPFLLRVNGLSFRPLPKKPLPLYTPCPSRLT
jgi:hypothetical protein